MRKHFTLYLILALIGFYFIRYRVTPGMQADEITIRPEQPTQLTTVYKGPILVNFYAAWCGECMAEMAELEAASKKAGFTFVGVTDDDLSRIDMVRQRFSITFPLEKLETSLKDYGVHTIPTTFLFDANGREVESWIGAQPWSNDDFLNKMKTKLSE
ncbi:MAG: hypothetical protein RL226_1393 [Bacteroidota bacterium]